MKYTVLKSIIRIVGRHIKTFLLVIVVFVFILIGFHERYTEEHNEIRRNSVNDPSFVTYHNYCVHYDIIAPKLSEYDRIAQILHISADFLDEKMMDQVENWNAPMSLSIVLTHTEQYSCVLQKIKSYAKINSVVEKYLRAHLIYPNEWSSNCEILTSPTTCEKRNATIDEMANYPANLARNVARMFSSAKYILIADFEHLFSGNFESDVLQIAEQHITPGRKSVLVYRIFEIDEKVENPRTKADLLTLFENRSAVVFHESFNKGSHSIPHLKEWFASNTSNNGIFSKDLKYRIAAWEPQFVSLSDIPMHDEAFPFRIKDNTVLRWEVCRAGYHFDVLSNHFMFHRGIKGKVYGAKGIALQKKNRPKANKAFASMRERFKKQYPDTVDKCPKV